MARLKRLQKEEIERAFAEGSGTQVPVILSPMQLAGLYGVSVKTIYQWIAMGRLEGTFRKRGKHIRFWRDRVIDCLFNGKEWTNEK